MTQTESEHDVGTDVPVKMRKKLIEVALPLEAINKASAREKSIRHGHPSTLHLWWARRPLAAARAVIFSQMVDDPSDVHRRASRRSGDEAGCRARAGHAPSHWLEKRAHQAEAAAVGDIDDPDPGPEPTLEECAADLERAAALRAHRGPGHLGEHHQRVGAPAGPRRDLGELAADLRRQRRSPAGRPSCSIRTKLPAFHDPFAGGGALPLEAQRLGLEATPATSTRWRC